MSRIIDERGRATNNGDGNNNVWVYQTRKSERNFNSLEALLTAFPHLVPYRDSITRTLNVAHPQG